MTFLFLLLACFLQTCIHTYTHVYIYIHIYIYYVQCRRRQRCHFKLWNWKSKIVSIALPSLIHRNSKTLAQASAPKEVRSEWRSHHELAVDGCQPWRLQQDSVTVSIPSTQHRNAELVAFTGPTVSSIWDSESSFTPRRISDLGDIAISQRRYLMVQTKQLSWCAFNLRSLELSWRLHVLSIFLSLEKEPLPRTPLSS